MTIDDIADEIYRELDFPSDLTRSDIAHWIHSNLGKLNTLLQTSYALDEDGVTFSESLPLEVKDIFKQIYFISFYDQRIIQGIVLAEDGFAEITSHDATIVFENQISTTESYLAEKKGAMDRLKKMIFGYNSTKRTLPYELNLVPISEEAFEAELVNHGWLTSRATTISE